MRAYDPMDSECRPFSPAEPMSGARLVGRGSSRRVTATLLPGNAGSDHSVYLGDRLIGNTRGATGNSSVDLGPFAYGQELELSIRVLDGAGRTFRAGPAGRNADKLVHALLLPIGTDGWRVGFEDLEGGGDADFNDAIVVIRGDLAVESKGALRCHPSPRHPN